MEIKSAPKWAPVKIKLKDIRLNPNNPKYLTERAADFLDQSVDLLGQMTTLAIGPDGLCYDGNMRVQEWIKHLGPDHEVLCLQSDRELNKEEQQRAILLTRKATLGEFDMPRLLAEFERDLLLTTGFSDDDLNSLADKFLDSAEQPEDFKEYDENIETKHECPKCGYRFS